MRINFLEIAQVELDDAISYYNYEVPGLGDAFLTEVLNAVGRIGEISCSEHRALLVPRKAILRKNEGVKVLLAATSSWHLNHSAGAARLAFSIHPCD